MNNFVGNKHEGRGKEFGKKEGKYGSHVFHCSNTCLGRWAFPYVQDMTMKDVFDPCTRFFLPARGGNESRDLGLALKRGIGIACVVCTLGCGFEGCVSEVWTVTREPISRE
ncbi:hypothetical protein CEXT_451161 [Caerostris extrusa]|uniref:Uncharacterized protein n=1 Tax=Caerostris extrusa TaxID=172846 RepID=A0AAV4Y521_CAEEX|nr:hypothetical protein CEXT_451161 [Caerostris extrusa]